MSLYSDALWNSQTLAPSNITWGTELYFDINTYGQLTYLFDNISSVVNVSYSYGYAGPYATTMIKYDSTDRSSAVSPDYGSDVWLSTKHYKSAVGYGYDWYGNYGYYSGYWLSDHSPGSFNYADLLHELGHTLGLAHIHVGDNPYEETPALLNLRGSLTYFLGDGTSFYNGDFLNKAWVSIMSYDYAQNPYSLTPMILDVITLAEKYGAPTRNIGDSIYSFSNDSFMKNFYKTVVDSSGVDLIDLSDQAINMFIDLGKNIGAVYNVGIVTTTTGWSNIHNGLNPLTLTWLFGSFENATAGSGDDVIVGNDTGNTLIGGLGNDTITGGGGNDVIDCGSGTNDTCVYSLSRSSYTITYYSGTYTVTALSGNEGTDSITGLESLSFYDQIIAVSSLDFTAPTVASFSPTDGLTNVAAGSNIVVTFSEAIKFGTGAIEIRSGSASGTVVATYNVATNAGANLSISSNTLTINPSTDLSASTNYYVTFASGAILDLSNNAYTGTTAYDFTTSAPTPLNLIGTSNAETLTGGAGNDTLTGLGGTDTMNGGNGSDLYIMTVTADHTAAEINDTGLSGTDEVRFTTTTASTLTLYAGDTGIENITIGTGTAASAVTTGIVALNINAAALTYGVTITGNAGNNILTGTLGYNDTLVGGLGNDTYVVNNAGDLVTEALSAGTDLIQSTISFTASSNVENLTLTGTSNINATGNTLANTLTGNTGNNTLDGGAEIDTLVGGTGNDTYIVDLLATGLLQDTVTEASTVATEIDTIQLRGNFTLATSATVAGAITLGTNINNLDASNVTSSTGLLNLVGNTLSNTITGSSYNDVITGAAGTDTLNGGDGNDLFIVALTADHTSTETINGGNGTSDEIRFTSTTASTLTLSSNVTNVENITIGTGTAASAVTTGIVALNINAAALTYGVTITGNAGNNILTGGSGDDTLYGKLGNDTMTGGLGLDTFVFDTTLNATSNRDTITDFSHNDDTIQLSKSVMSALGALGTLSVNDFKVSTGATGVGTITLFDTTDHIIYNQTSGALFYDADGSGATAAIQIALIGVTIHPADINYTDFMIV